MILELGKENRLPLSPAISRKDPIEAARPTQMVEIDGLMNIMVSYMASPADTDPPGELM